MNPARLPIGIQTFRELREAGYYYVDKTSHIPPLLNVGKHYFLSRPRRFGKSLFLDTLRELFLGSEPLFRGLAIHDRWDWSVSRPVVSLSFDGGPYSEPGQVKAELMERLDAIEQEHGIRQGPSTASGRLRHLLAALHRRTGRRAVVLVDEYDKPILDALRDPDIARANRDFLRGVYGIVKGADAHIRFTFIAGVSKFSKVSLFSGLNNLLDITMNPDFSSICGYTEGDLDTVFADELPGLDREAIRDWYNGYSWLGEERVYNPFDMLLLFYHRTFKSYWFETGTPTFLVETLFNRRVTSLELDDMVGTEALLSTFDVDHIATEALLFQTGYLTIVGEEKAASDAFGDESFYRLGYPNREVRQSLNRSLLAHMTSDASGTVRNALRLRRLLADGDAAGLEGFFHALFAGIPYEWHTRNDLACYEGHYASVFHACFMSLGADVTVEDSGSRGCLDMAVRFAERVYLFEFKVVERASEGAAMAQLKARGYADKYRARGEPIHLVGVEFSRETRNVTAFEVDRVPGVEADA